MPMAQPYPTKHVATPSPTLTQHAPIIISDPPVNPNPDSVHHMVTHFCVGTNHPIKHLSLHVSFVAPLPKSYREAFNDVHWQNSMRDEYNALIKNSTWTLVPRPPDVNLIRCMWLFRHKYLADGTLSRYKSWLVAIGSTLLEGVDVDETFSLVVKPGTIPTVLIYLHRPPVFWDFAHPDYVISSLHQEFAMTDLGSLNYFFGISVTQDSSGMFYLKRSDVVSDLTLNQSLAGYCVFLSNNLLSRYSKCQPMFSHSSVEAEYQGVSNAVTETCWLWNLLRELHTPLSSATLVYLDNINLVAAGQVRVLHVPSRYQYEDIFTKGLPTALFEEFCFSLSVWCPPAQTAGEC
ncbi:ribonuclease H-like domain-containing protein [Tanacetum coccineum]